jgi:glutathione S-transferase
VDRALEILSMPGEGPPCAVLTEQRKTLRLIFGEVRVDLAGGLLRHVTGKLAQLEALHVQRVGEGGPFFGGTSPAVADAFVFESLDRAGAVFGVAFQPALASCPRMAALDAAMHDRLNIARLFHEGRVAWPVSASPTEEEVRERLAEIAETLDPG